MSGERFHSPAVDSCSAAGSRDQRWGMRLGRRWSQTGWTSESFLSVLEAPGAYLTVLLAPVGLLVGGSSMNATACWEVVGSEHRSVAWKVGTIAAASQSQRPAMGALSEQRKLARQMLKREAFLGRWVFRGQAPLNPATWFCRPPTSAFVSRLSTPLTVVAVVPPVPGVPRLLWFAGYHVPPAAPLP